MKSNVFLLALLILGAGCHKNNGTTPGYPGGGPPPGGGAQGIVQTNLVADVPDFQPAKIDAKLLNAWGIAVNPAGFIWISDNHSGATSIVDSTGLAVLNPIAIPSQGAHFGGSPTGIVFNGTNDFMIAANNTVSKFIFVNEDGTISAWGIGDSTLTVVDRSAAGAVYKGVAIANDGGANFLYAANFKGGKIEVFDKSFAFITTKPFTDPDIPAGFGPFNIQNIGNKLYVTYAKLKAPDNEDDEAGAGNGYVDIFNPDGTLVKRFASQGTLNSPWGIAQAPAGSGLPLHSILIGNFGDGHINIYDSTGTFTQQLQSNGQPVIIAGLWALDFPYNEFNMSDPKKLYFTAGPMDETHGVFGSLKLQ